MTLRAYIVQIETPDRIIKRIPVAETYTQAIKAACDKIPDDTIVLRLTCKPTAIQESIPCAA